MEQDLHGMAATPSNRQSVKTVRRSQYLDADGVVFGRVTDEAEDNLLPGRINVIIDACNLSGLLARMTPGKPRQRRVPTRKTLERLEFAPLSNGQLGRCTIIKPALDFSLGNNDCVVPETP